MKHTIIQHFFLLTFLIIGCQSEKDTVSVLLAEADALIYEYPDSALRLLENISHPEQLQGKEQADYALFLSLARYRCNLPIISDSLICIAVQYYQDKDNADKCASAWYTYGGIISEIEDDYETIIHAYKEAERCIPRINDSTLIALIYSNLAYLNKKALHYEQAKTYYQKAEQINRLTANYRSLASNYLNLCSIYWALGQSDSTEWCVKQMLDICPLLTDSTQLGKIHHNIGTWYKNHSRYSEAEEYFKRSLQYTPASPSYKTLVSLGDLYTITGRNQENDSLYLKTLASTDMATRALVYRRLYKESLAEKKYQSAITYAENYIAASDSFYRVSLRNKVIEAQFKYDRLSLQHENVRQEKNLYLTILITLTLLVLAGYAIINHREKQKELNTSISILQKEIDNLNASMSRKDKIGEAEKAEFQKKIDQLEKLKRTYTQQGKLDISEIKAAGTIKTITKDLKYTPDTDRKHLIHWLNIHRNGFAIRLQQNYPQLTQGRQLDVCYLSAAGFDAKHIARLLDIKERSVEHYMTDICKKIQYPEEGKKGFQSLILELCMHPDIKKDAENIAVHKKFE